MDQEKLSGFKEKLDQHYAWPALYTFKFIVPTGKEGELKSMYPNHTPTEKLSQNGKYTSITWQMLMPSSEAVIEIYVTVSKIEGLIAL